jgi:steroid delta-isomerase-like uncharacterized protein
MADNKTKYLECWHRAWNLGQVDAFDDLMSPGYIRHSSTSALGPPMTLAELKESIRILRTAFPDLVTTIDDVVGTDEGFTLRWSSQGTHLAAYMAVPATGRSISVSGVTICRFKGDRVAEEWVTWDARDLLAGLGISMLANSPGADDLDDSGQLAVRAAHRKFVTGVTVVTTNDGDTPRGLAVNAFMSVSLTPPLVLICVAKTSQTHNALFRAEAFAVNVLSAGQADIARRFASKMPGKFLDLQWRRGLLGCPLLENSCAFFEARVRERVQVSTHTMFVGQVEAVGTTDLVPLVYLGGEFFEANMLQRLTG